MSLGVLPELIWTARFIHFLGLGMAFGAAVGAVFLLRRGMHDAVGPLVQKVEIPGLFVAMSGGILLVITRPELLDIDKSGAGPWLHIKFALVLGVLVVAHLRMFNAKRLDEADATERAKKLDLAALALYAAILFVASFRVMLFG